MKYRLRLIGGPVGLEAKQMSDLDGKMIEHAEHLESLRVEIEQALAEIDRLSQAGREALAEYQRRKRLASEALTEASRPYLRALYLERQLSQFDEQLRSVWSEHRQLSESVMALRDKDPGQAQAAVERLRPLRESLLSIRRQLDEQRVLPEAAGDEDGGQAADGVPVQEPAELDTTSSGREDARQKGQ